MTPGRKKALLILPILALAGAGYAYHRHGEYGRFQEETNDATIQADQVTISSKLAGYVRAIPVDDNQLVNETDMLLQIEPTDVNNRIRSADAEISAALASERTAGASRAEAEAEIGRINAELQAALSNLAYASREVSRYRPLVAAGAEPASTLSQQIANRDRAQAEVAAKQAALIEVRQRINTTSAQTAQVSAQVNAARVQRSAVNSDLWATRLVAPIKGRVANRSVRVGQFVQPGMRLMTIVPSDDIYVVANFKETQVGLMRPGQPVTITVDALPDVEFAGKVSSITPGTGASFSLIAPQNATGNFTKIVQRVPVRIQIDAGPKARRVLVPGLSLVVTVDTRANVGELADIRAEQQQRSNPRLALGSGQARRRK